MRCIFNCMLYFIMACFALFLISDSAAACNLFIVKEDQNSVSLQSVQLEANKIYTFSGENFITFVLPVSPGKSGSVIQLAHRQVQTSVACDGENISITITNPDGSTRDYPRVKLTDLRSYQIRVNIVGGNGLREVYQIKNYDSVKLDAGPVFDMLGSLIPLSNGEYSITTETEIVASQNLISGKIQITYEHPLIFTEGKIAAGRSGAFIVDFGAGGTVVGKDYLPDNAEIAEVSSVMYSEKGEEVSPGIMAGAGGDVSGFLGNATLGELAFGEVIFRNVTVRVIENLPDFNGKRVAGIIGLDLLKQGGIVSLEYKSSSSENAYMYFGAARSPQLKMYQIPFSYAYGHIFLEGTMHDVPVSYLFDTGARSIYISKSIAAEAAVEKGSDAFEVKGLDTNKTEAYYGQAKFLDLGEHRFKDVPLVIADLQVLKGMGLLERGGLLGNSFLEKFQMVQIDFGEKMVRLWE